MKARATATRPPPKHSTAPNHAVQWGKQKAGRRTRRTWISHHKQRTATEDSHVDKFDVVRHTPRQRSLQDRQRRKARAKPRTTKAEEQKRASASTHNAAACTDDHQARQAARAWWTWLEAQRIRERDRVYVNKAFRTYPWYSGSSIPLATAAAQSSNAAPRT